MGAEGLDFRVVPLAFTSGQDTRTQKKLVIPSKWDTLVNYSLSENNTPKRRDGCAPVVTAAAGNGLALHDDELLVINGGAVSTVMNAAASTNAVSGTYSFVDVTKGEVSHTSGNQDSPDCAYGN